MARPRLHLGVFALFVLIVALRLAYLGEFPAWHSDEGFWANGARNHVLFGDAFLDGRLHPLLSPATYAALVAHFSLFAPTLVSARLFSAIAGILTCLVLWLAARRLFRARPWLPLFFFGVSGFVVLVHRITLLEAHQTLWLVLAAALYLVPFRGSMWLAGAAYGVALLVKSNSLYLAPAFLAALPAVTAAAAGDGARAPARTTTNRLLSKLVPLVPLAPFTFAAVLVAASGYGLAFARDPEQFRVAFGFELEARHFLDVASDPVLFHVGRFGFRPVAAVRLTFSLLKSEPFLTLLAAVAIARVLRRPAAAPREDRFFAAWALACFLFDLVQLNITQRYLGSMMPALAFLSARTLERALTTRPRRALALALCLAFAAFHVTRVGLGIRHAPNRDYWQTVDWIRTHVPRETGVMAASYIALSLPQESHDFFRVLFPYGGDHPLTLATELPRRHLTVIVRDSEWRHYETPEMASFLATHCTRLATFGAFEVLGVSGVVSARQSETALQITEVLPPDLHPLRGVSDVVATLPQDEPHVPAQKPVLDRLPRVR